jgi:RHS repeat-associated protein
LGRCISTHFPETLDEKQCTYRPSVSFSYDLQGNLTSVSAETATTTTIYNTLRKPLKIIHPDGTCLRHTYSKRGTLIRTTHPDGTHTDCTYDRFQRITSKQTFSSDEELLSAETWQYNAFHLLAYTDPNGLTTYSTYDPIGRLSATQVESHKVSYTYDPLGFLESTVEAEIEHVEIHDQGGRIIQKWEEIQGKIENLTTFSYDEENRKTEATRQTSLGEAVDSFTYDRHSRLASHTDPEGHTSQFLYTEKINALGQRVLQKRTIDPIGNQTMETSDCLNRPVSTSEQIPKTASPPLKSSATIALATKGNSSIPFTTNTCLNGLFLSTGTTISWAVPITESTGTTTTRFSYDQRGRVATRCLPSGTTIAFDYDGMDRVVEMKSSDQSVHYQYVYATGTEPIVIFDQIQGTQLSREYNRFGKLTQEINPDGLRTAWEYDEDGRCTRFILPDRSTIDYSYQGHLTEISRYNPEHQLLYTHRYNHFDPNGNPSEEQLLGNIGSVYTTRDLLERPTAQTSPWLAEKITYGPSGLVMSIHNSLTGDRAYSYDALNQLISQRTERGALQHPFDSLGNPIDAEVNNQNQIVAIEDTYLEYDLNGNPVKRISLEGTTTYTYDALNRLTSITDPNGNKTLYRYDPLSRLISQQSDELIDYLYDKTQEIGAINSEGVLVELKVIGLGLPGEIGRAVALEIQGDTFAPLHDIQGNSIALVSQEGAIIESYQIDPFGKQVASSLPKNPWRFSGKRSVEQSLNGLVFFGLRFYDPTLGRWLTPDPNGFTEGANLYLFVLNSPLNRLDLFGLTADPRLLHELDFVFRMLEMRISLDGIKQAAKEPPPARVSLPCQGSLGGVPVNWVVSSGNWSKLQFTPQENATGTVNIVEHFQELLPAKGGTIGLITAQNGISTSPIELARNVQTISNKIPEGTLIIGMYNPTRGIFRDVKRTFSENKGRDTPTVVRTRQFMIAISHTLHRLNPELLWLHIPHSEAGVIANNAIKGMTDQQKRTTEGSATYSGFGSSQAYSY